MRFKEFLRLTLLVSTGLSVVGAATVYDEAVNGDLSNNGPTPTSIALLTGSNQIFGTTGRAAAIDRDYFTVTIPTGLSLTSLTLLPGSSSGGISFIGIEAGSVFNVPPTASDAVGLLGWWHYSPADINTNLLPVMAVPSQGSSGFITPLGSGSYSFWVQDFNAGSFSYGFDLTVGAGSTAVPEPATYSTVIAGVATLAAAFRRRFRRVQ